MQLKIEIPDELAMALTGSRPDAARAVLEAVGLEAYRERRISGYQLRKVLGLESRFDLDAFLKAHQVESYTVADFDQDLAGIRRSRTTEATNPGT